MRRLAFLFVAAAAGACGGSHALSPADVDSQTKIIGTMLDDWHDAAAHAQQERYFEHLAPGCVFIGTDPTERWDCDAFKSYVSSHFQKKDGWTLRSTRRNVHFGPNGDVAWFDEELESKELGATRATGVLLRGSANHWLVVQYSLSVPIPNDRIEDVRKAMAAAR